MPWYAFDAVDDALDATRNFLFPFSWGRWLRLAVIVFFLGGGGGGTNLSNIPSSLPSDGGTTPTAPGAPTVPGGALSMPELWGLSPSTVWLIVAAFTALFVALMLALVVASSVMPFVFVDALRTNEVRVRGPFKRRFWKGIRLLAFQLGVVLLFVAPFALAVALLVVTNPNTAAFESFVAGFGLVGLLGLFAVLLVAAVVVGLLLGFTRQFVVPVMIVTDGGVVSSWRAFWPTLRGQWKQFVVYLFVRFVLHLGVAIAQGILSLVLGGIVVVVALVVGFLVALAFGGIEAMFASTAGLVAVAVLILLTLFALLVVFTPIKILVQTYFTTYELSVLGAANPAFDLLPERPGGGTSDDSAGTSDDEGGDGGDGDDADAPSTGEGASTDDGFVWGDGSTTT